MKSTITANVIEPFFVYAKSHKCHFDEMSLVVLYRSPSYGNVNNNVRTVWIMCF